MRRRRGTSSLVDALVPRERGVFELLDRQAVAVAGAADTLERVVHHWPEDGLLAQLTAKRHEADAAGDEVFARVHMTFVTALEREDAVALSSAMTALATHAERTGLLLDAYRLQRAREPARRVTHLLVEASRALVASVATLGERAGLPNAVAELRRLEADLSPLLREALPDLLADDPSSSELVAWRDIYDELEDSAAALNAATRALRAVELKGP
jgi:uncharacterized protein Yka (UPF0111/DUF47 family)